MGKRNKAKRCSNCGAPVTTEICPYCNSFTGLDPKDANMEYPVIECKEASINFFLVSFAMIFAFSFGFFGFVVPFVFSMAEGDFFGSIMLMTSPFSIVGIVAFVFGIRPVIRYLSIKLMGKEIESTVYGYMDDNFILNGIPTQIVKLLVNTNDGPKFILYQTGDTKQPYKINSKIKLKVYKDIFLIEHKKQYYFE